MAQALPAAPTSNLPAACNYRESVPRRHTKATCSKKPPTIHLQRASLVNPRSLDAPTSRILGSSKLVMQAFSWWEATSSYPYLSSAATPRMTYPRGCHAQVAMSAVLWLILRAACQWFYSSYGSCSSILPAGALFSSTSHYGKVSWLAYRLSSCWRVRKALMVGTS